LFASSGIDCVDIFCLDNRARAPSYTVTRAIVATGINWNMEFTRYSI